MVLFKARMLTLFFQKNQLRRKSCFSSSVYSSIWWRSLSSLISCQGLIWVESVWAALVAAFLLGIVNAVLRPILIFFTLPITVLTFGLFLLVINGLMLLLVSSIVRGFHVNGFWGAVLGSILISLVSWVLSRFLPS